MIINNAMPIDHLGRVNNTARNVIFNHSLTNHNSRYNPFTDNENSNHRILIVEPEKNTRTIHLKFLQKMGFTKINFANCSKKAFKLIEIYPFSMILLEINLTDNNGIDLFKLIRKNTKNKNAQIILATSYMKDAVCDICQSHDIEGIENVITKPFLFSDYAYVLKSCLANIDM